MSHFRAFRVFFAPGRITRSAFLSLLGFLTKKLKDEAGLEFGSLTEVEGLGLIDQEVSYGKEKTLALSRAVFGRTKVEGYEIRRGKLKGRDFYMEIVERNGQRVSVPDGYYDGNVFATSLHGSLSQMGAGRCSGK